MDMTDFFKLIIQGVLVLIFLMILAWFIPFLSDVVCYLKGNADSLQACRNLPYIRIE